MLNSEHATMYGVEEALFLHNLIFWIRKNKSNNKHFHDEHTWTYNSTKALSELFPFWSIKQINRIIQNLKKQKVILTGNYNKTQYDRTRWFALVDESLIRNQTKRGEVHFPIKENGVSQEGKPIPDNNTDSNTDIKEKEKKNTSDKSEEFLFSPSTPVSSKEEKTSSVVKEIVSYLNAKANKHYRSNNPKTIQLIKARLKEGFTISDFKKVIDNKVDCYKKGLFDEKYLRPITLFGTKFEGYLNENTTSEVKDYNPQLTKQLIKYYSKNIVGLSADEEISPAVKNLFISASARISQICKPRKIPPSKQINILWDALKFVNQLENFKTHWLSADWLYNETILKYLKKNKLTTKKEYKTRVGMRAN